MPKTTGIQKEAPGGTENSRVVATTEGTPKKAGIQKTAPEGGRQ
jgi:hypothetical protein